MNDNQPKVDAEPNESAAAVERMAEIINDSEDRTLTTSATDQNSPQQIRKNVKSEKDGDLEASIVEASKQAEQATRKALDDSSSKEPNVNVAPWAIGLLIIGLVFIVTAMLTGNRFPIPTFGEWNIGIGIFLSCYAGLMMLSWR